MVLSEGLHIASSSPGKCMSQTVDDDAIRRPTLRTITIGELQSQAMLKAMQISTGVINLSCRANA